MCFIIGKSFNDSSTQTLSRIVANKIYKLDNFDINTTYSNQHNEIINNKIKNTCTYEEGKQIMKVINQINLISRIFFILWSNPI